MRGSCPCWLQDLTRVSQWSLSALVPAQPDRESRGQATSLFEALEASLVRQDPLGQNIHVSQYPAKVDCFITRILNSHRHLHRQVVPKPRPPTS